MGFHRGIVPTADPNAGPHVVHQFQFVDAGAMSAGTDSLKGAVTLTAADVGMVCRVGAAAPYDFYVLTNHVGPVWEQINGGGGGGGDVTGPGSSNDNAIARYDGTTGKTIQNSGATIDDAGVITAAGLVTAGTVDGRDVSADGTLLDATAATVASLAANAIVDGDYAGTYAGDQIRTGAAAYAVVRHNRSATAAPTVNDDSTLNYEVGSRWFDVTADRAYTCLDASAGAAVWREVSVVAAAVAAAGAVMDSDFAGSYAADLTRTGAGAYVGLRNNLAASTSPSATDDSASDYAVGSRWIDTTADRAWTCVDATPGAAVWIEGGGSGGGPTFRGLRGFSLSDYLERAVPGDLAGNASPGFEVYAVLNVDELRRGLVTFVNNIVSTAGEFVGPGYRLAVDGSRPIHTITDGGGAYLGNFLQDWLLDTVFKKPLIPISMGFDGSTRFLKLGGLSLFSAAMTGFTPGSNPFRVGRPGGAATGGALTNATLFALAAKTNGVLSSSEHETILRTFLATGDLPNSGFTSRWSFASLSVGAAPATVPDAIGSNALTLVGSLSVVADKFTGQALVGDPASTSVKIGGQIGGTVTAPDVRGWRETGGPTLLTLGAIPDDYAVVRSGTTVVGRNVGTNLLKTVRGFASGAAAGDRAAYERAGGDPFTGSFTFAAIFQSRAPTFGSEQRICGTTTEFATNGICLAYQAPGYVVVRGADNLAAAITRDTFDSKIGLDLVHAIVTFDSTTGVVSLYLNGAPPATVTVATGAITPGGNFTIGASAGALGTTGASNIEIHGAALLLGTAITDQQAFDWWRSVIAGATIGSGPAAEAWSATDDTPTSSTWAPSVGATSLSRVGSATAPTRHDVGRVWFRA